MNATARSLEVLFTPADFATLPGRNLSDAACVVFDVLRATSTIVTALANGAEAVIPVAEIGEALAIRSASPQTLLAGERNGLRIRSDLTGGIDFDLGNSPREFLPERISGKSIAITTTNGSRALRASAGASTVLAGAFLNLHATADYLAGLAASKVLLVCSGTGEEAAYEDVLGAGALAGLLWKTHGGVASDSAHLAKEIYERNKDSLMQAMSSSSNGRRLLKMPELRDDVAFCFQANEYNFVARMQNGRMIRLSI